MFENKKFEQYLEGKLDYKDLKSKIKLAVYGPDYIGATDVVRRSPAERLNLAVVVEFKNQVVNYIKLPLETNDNTEILENALIQTFEDDIKYFGKRQNISNDGENKIDFISFTGESYFLSTLLFNKYFIEEYKGKNGYIFGIPDRKNFLFAPINDTDKLSGKLIIFAYYIFELYKSASKPVLPDIFYSDNKRLENIFKYNGDEPNGLIIPKEWTDQNN
jgi:hypothetical protein